MRFYLDEDLSPRIAAALRARGLDAVSAHEVGNQRLADGEHLAYAAGAGRSLVTGDVRHFVALGRQAVNLAAPHAGIVLLPSGRDRSDIGGVVRALARLAEQHPAGLDKYDVVYL